MTSAHNLVILYSNYYQKSAKLLKFDFYASISILDIKHLKHKKYLSLFWLLYNLYSIWNYPKAKELCILHQISLLI